MELSYDNLSRELKSCFIYLGIFPEDYEIHREKLIQLWIAEDLIPQDEGLDLEELVESYIKELNNRSLIQSNTMYYNMRWSCRVGDLLRDLVVNKAKELDFFRIYDEFASPSIKPFSTSRIAFRSGFDKYTAIDDHSHTQVHTLSFLNYYNRCLDDGISVETLQQTLDVLFNEANYRLSIEPLFSCKNLISLKLVGRIKSLLPMELHESLPILRYLTLFEAEFVQCPLPALKKLPNLLVLHLYGFQLKSLIITATGFYKVATLSILEIPEYMNLQIEEGALPSLKQLRLYPLNHFTTLPVRFKNLGF